MAETRLTEMEIHLQVDLELLFLVMQILLLILQQSVLV
jgi:hypothetical protein